mgnify:CR=1 FL=1
MNTEIAQNYEMLLGMQVMRDQLLDVFTDADLNYRLGGNTFSVGQLFHEFGDVEQSYTDSFKTLTQAFDYPTRTSAFHDTIAKLKAWFVTLDAEMKATLESVTGDEVVERGFPMPIGIQIMAYREAVLVIASKMSVYLRALQRPMPEQIKGWVD